MLVTMLPTQASAGIEPYISSGATPQTPQPMSNPFDDVSESDWFYQSVMDAVEKGIFQGTGDASFTPSGTLTRGMYVTVLGRIAGINPADYPIGDDFLDVDPDAYYAPYVAWANKMGITSGVGGNKFGPGGIVSREQMAVFTLRYFDAYKIPFGNADVVDTSPKDLSKVSDWAQEAVLKLWKAGLLKGDAQGNINPSDHATRAEAASFTVQTEDVVAEWRVENGTDTSKPKEVPTLNSPSVQYKVSFETNGGSTVLPMYVVNGKALNELPTPQKDNAIFMGWYRQPGLQEPQFLATDIVTTDITLYAKYMIIQDSPEAEVDDTFALMDQAANLTFTIHATDLGMDSNTVKTKLSLSVMDGSEASVLNVAGGNGVFTVSAPEGFSEGAS